MTAAETRAEMVEDVLTDAYEHYFAEGMAQMGTPPEFPVTGTRLLALLYAARQSAAREVQAVAEKFLREGAGE